MTDMRKVPMVYIMAVGSIEKVMIPGLQIIYSLGFDRSEHVGDDYHMGFCTEEDYSEIMLSYKFNDRPCKLKITKNGKGFGEMYMYLYVED